MGLPDFSTPPTFTFYTFENSTNPVVLSVPNTQNVEIVATTDNIYSEPIMDEKYKIGSRIISRTQSIDPSKNVGYRETCFRFSDKNTKLTQGSCLFLLAASNTNTGPFVNGIFRITSGSGDFLFSNGYDLQLPILTTDNVLSRQHNIYLQEN